MAVLPADVDRALVRVRDLAGRPRGTGFLVEARDGRGTLVTSHEAVDGLVRLVLHAHGEQTTLVEAHAITPLPELGLALVATEGLDVPPLPVAGFERSTGSGRAVRLRGTGWVEAAIAGTAPVTYTATDRFHLLDAAYELAGARGDDEPLRAVASGEPVIDAETGAVHGVVVTALHAGRRAGGFAVPLRAPAQGGALGEALARNAATVPAYGPHLNIAGALQLTGTSVASAARPRAWREAVVRPDTEAELARFTGEGCATVLGLVGAPGSGRTTELEALAARRAAGPDPAPTVWLRGAELRADEPGLRRPWSGRWPRRGASCTPGRRRSAHRPTRRPMPSPAWRAPWGDRCSSCWTLPRRCRRCSPTRCPGGARRRRAGCAPPGRG